MENKLFSIKVKVPSTVANLGAGYDCLALALEYYNQFNLYYLKQDLPRDFKEFTILLNGKYADADTKMMQPNGNLFVKGFKEVISAVSHLAKRRIKPFPIFISQEVLIPPKRGLGSSSTASVAGVLAGFEFVKRNYPEIDYVGLLKNENAFKFSNWECIQASIAMNVDSCPDNICASLSGGLTSSFYEDDKDVAWGNCPMLHYFKDDINDANLRCIALIPNKPLSTPEARKLLKNHPYSDDDVAFNISRSTCLTYAFREKRYDLLKFLTQDKIHQHIREKHLFVDERNKTLNLQFIFNKVLEVGAYGAFIGGAGSTLIALCDANKAETVKSIFIESFNRVIIGDWEEEDTRILSITNNGANCEFQEVSPNSIKEDRLKSWYEKLNRIRNEEISNSTSTETLNKLFRENDLE